VTGLCQVDVFLSADVAVGENSYQMGEKNDNDENGTSRPDRDSSRNTWPWNTGIC
jgi:hypothetical protein